MNRNEAERLVRDCLGQLAPEGPFDEVAAAMGLGRHAAVHAAAFADFDDDAMRCPGAASWRRMGCHDSRASRM